MQQLESSAMLLITRSHTVTVAAIAGLLLLGIASPANAATAYYPSGPQVDVPKSTVTSGGWTLCWDEAFDGESNVLNIIAGTDNHSLSPCNTTHLLITGWDVAEPSNLILLAAAPGADIFTETTLDSGSGVSNAHLSNGTWWVFTPGKSMGFGPTNDLSQTPGEHRRYDGSDPQRMSWHMFADDEVSRTTLLRAGWSIGVHEQAANSYHRAIYAEIQPNVAKQLPNTGTSPTVPAGLAALALLAGFVLFTTARRKKS